MLVAARWHHRHPAFFTEEIPVLPEIMRTVEMREPGDAGVLEPGTRPLPTTRPGELLLKVIAAGVNGPDLVQRRGHYPPPAGASDLLGLEVSGEVVARSEATRRFAVGDTVCGLANGGGYAEYVAIDESHCLPVPDGIDPVDAAGLPETLFTVWSNCFFEQVQGQARGENALFLVHGGAGGIGTTATQMGAALGLRVFTTCSGAEDAAWCEDNGAERAIDYRTEDFVEVVKEAGGANLILDIIGGDYIARNIKAASKDARIVQLAFNHGSRVEIDLMPIMLKRLLYTGSTLRSRPERFKADIASDLEAKVWPWFGSGAMRPCTHTILPFDRAGEAHRLMESGEHRGKILLVP